MIGRVHVVGAGLSGLATATALAERGVAVTLSEALAQAGGRCRSYLEPALGMEIDNGSHLVLSGNWAVRGYLNRIGSADALAGPDHADFDFCDVRDGARWTLRMNDGPLPWWIFRDGRRVPGTTALDYARFAGLIAAGADRTVGEVVPTHGAAWERLLRPLLLAVMNTEPEVSSAALAAAVLRETVLKGGRACLPRIARPTLGTAFVDPALAYLAAKGTTVAFRRKLTAIGFDGDRVARLQFSDGEERLGAQDCLVLAVPSWFARELVPGLSVPDEHRAIVNLHYAFAAPAGTPCMLGVLGGTAEWVFAHRGRIAVTVSAAEAIAGENKDALAARVWGEVCRSYGIDALLPPFALVRERRATFAATPEQNRKRPQMRTKWRNLLLAGDWTATGLPSTIEGAVRSGLRAAEDIVRSIAA